MPTEVATPARLQSQPEPVQSRRWLVLAIVALAQLMVILDGTIVLVALPHAQKALQISNADRQWVVTAYALAFGGLLLLGGRIADYTGRKRIFLIGLAGFAAASALGGAAQSGDWLFGARALQGAFAALLAPAALSIVTTTFTAGVDRVRAFAIYGAVSASGGALGLLLGGVLTQYLSWRWTLLVNTPIAIIAGLAGVRFVSESKASGKTRYDIPGAASSTLGLVSLVYGFSKAGVDGWGSSTTLGFLAIGVALLIVFVIVELRSSHPLLPLQIVLDRNRGGANLAAITIAAAIVGGFLFLVYYLQGTLGYSPVKTGLATVPMAIAIFPAVATATPLMARIGPRPIMTVGGIIAAAGLLVLSLSTVSSGYGIHVLPAELMLGFGMGLVFTPLQNLATLGVRGNDAGASSALVNASQQIGSALGAAVFNTFFVSAVASYITSHPGTHTAQAHALVHGYDKAFLIAAIAALLAAGFSAFLIHAKREELPAASAVPVPA